MTSVRAGDYSAAIEYFEAARRAGLDTGALHFNLGVAYYRAGRVEQAEAAFQRAARSETMVAPALYQLGRLARERGDEDAARGYFRRAAASARTDALRRRAEAALTPRVRAAPPDYVYLSFGGGYDSNLALTPADASAGSEQSDLFVDGTLVARAPLDDRDYLRASVYLQEFVDEDDFTLAILRGGIGRVGTLGANWRWDAWVDARYQEFGGDAFEYALLAGGELRRRLDPAWLLALDYRLELTSGASGFRFLDGRGHYLSATLDQRGRDGWRLSAAAAATDRDDRETADDFFSFSWTEFGLEAAYGRSLATGDRLVLAGDWAHRDYDGTEVRNGSALGRRKDDRLGLEAALERDLDADWSARLSLRVERRDSNLAQFDYDREVLRVRLDRVF
ncbi:MAG: tetratricopeptide repeat protein [Halofilum sp. (in: g-proteobacteria)]|nr:tetratricopeptide repeat protein [Halofilum sp. (in: g-proteobacteria)]